MTEALRLFAARGFRGTTVDDIASAAGLAPRSGAVFKHFGTKRAILEAGVERAVVTIDRMRSVLDLLPLGDLRSELLLLARWTLQELREEHDLLTTLQREHATFPELAERVWERVIEVGYAEGEALFRRHLGEDGSGRFDPAATAVVALGALVNYSSTTESYGRLPGEVVEERFVATWVEVCLAVADARG